MEASEPRSVNERIERLGVRVEHREPDPLRVLVSTGLGSIAGQALGRMAHFGPVGVALSGLGGAVLGHIAAAYRIVPVDDEAQRPRPMRWSDRR